MVNRIFCVLAVALVTFPQALRATVMSYDYEYTLPVFTGAEFAALNSELATACGPTCTGSFSFDDTVFTGQDATSTVYSASTFTHSAETDVAFAALSLITDTAGGTNRTLKFFPLFNGITFVDFSVTFPTAAFGAPSTALVQCFSPSGSDCAGMTLSFATTTPALFTTTGGAITVPAPSTLACISLGLLGLGMNRRKRKLHM